MVVLPPRPPPPPPVFLYGVIMFSMRLCICQIFKYYFQGKMENTYLYNQITKIWIIFSLGKKHGGFECYIFLYIIQNSVWGFFVVCFCFLEAIPKHEFLLTCEGNQLSPIFLFISVYTEMFFQLWAINKTRPQSCKFLCSIVF